MATIYDYLTYYKDLSFRESSFNEVDNILFSELAYLDWEGIVPNNYKQISLNDAISLYFKKRKKKQMKVVPIFIQGNEKNLEIIQGGKRYQNCMLSYYRKKITDDMQFGALAVHISPSTLYVAFEGTDNSLGGWKEDFVMSYLFPIDSQKEAISYLNEVVHFSDRTIYVGGHSKGGNLAMTASMYCRRTIEKRIKTVFNNDGPGFKAKQFDSKEYQRMLKKLQMFTPEESIVGMLLMTAPNYQVVKSTVKGIRQHDCNTWKCFGSFLEKGTLLESSRKLDERFTKWLRNYSDEEREKMVQTLFTVLKNSNITTLDGIKYLEFTQIVTIIKKMKELDSDTKKLYLEALKNLIIIEKDAV